MDIETLSDSELATLNERVERLGEVNLADLEEELVTWEPPPDDRARTTESPDRIDALVHAAGELLDLSGTAKPGPSFDAAGLAMLTSAMRGGFVPSSVVPQSVPRPQPTGVVRAIDWNAVVRSTKNEVMP